MHSTIQPVILCGGNGTRLWPLSNSHCPKQFVSIVGNKTMLECTIDRINHLRRTLEIKTDFDLDRISYTVNEPLLIMHRGHNLPEALQFYADKVVLEEFSNDTGVAIARAVINIKNSTSSDIMIVFPSDHYIANVEAYIYDIICGLDLIRKDNIVLYGMEPTAANTQYGYIVSTENGVWFKEKPDPQTAVELIKQRAMWNSGIFACRVDHLYEVITTNRQLMWHIEHPRDVKADSFDVAVLQQHQNLVAHYCLQWGWSDVGTWESFLAIPEIQEEVNNSTVIMADCANVNVLNRNKGNVVVIGCSNLMIVSHGNDILVMPNTGDFNQQLKAITQQLV